MDIMIDLEYFGDSENAAIAQIGACFFGIESGKIKDETLSFNVDLQSCMDLGMEVEASTLYWWLSQKDEAIKSLLPFPLHISKALLTLYDFSFYHKFSNIWCHVLTDAPILRNAYKKCGLNKCNPFHPRQFCDIRTLLSLSGFDHRGKKFKGLKHKALDDCLHQVNYCSEAYKKLKRL